MIGTLLVFVGLPIVALGVVGLFILWDWYITRWEDQYYPLHQHGLSYSRMKNLDKEWDERVKQ